MALLSLLSLIVFAFEHSDFSDRIQITLTLMLTAVAFKFAVVESIPRVPYHTFLDKFVLMVMVEFSVTTIVCTLPYLAESRGWLGAAAAKCLDWTLFLFSVALALLPKISWSMQALNMLRCGESIVAAKEGSTFYLYRFTNVYFLPEIVSKEQEGRELSSAECPNLPTALALPRTLNKGMRSLSQIISSQSERKSPMLTLENVVRFLYKTWESGALVALIGALLFIWCVYYSHILQSTIIWSLLLLVPVTLWVSFGLLVFDFCDIYSICFGWIEATRIFLLNTVDYTTQYLLSIRNILMKAKH